MARYIAKNIVAAKLAAVCEIQLSYAIGVADPISVLIQCDRTAKVDEGRLAKIVQDLFPPRPGEIIEYLNLLRPIYQETAHDGHFGREGRNFTWERTDKVSTQKKAAKV